MDRSRLPSSENDVGFFGWSRCWPMIPDKISNFITQYCDTQYGVRLYIISIFVQTAVAAALRVYNDDCPLLMLNVESLDAGYDVNEVTSYCLFFTRRHARFLSSARSTLLSFASLLASMYCTYIHFCRLGAFATHEQCCHFECRG